MASLTLPAGYPVTQPFGCTGFYLEPAYGNCAHFHQGIDYGVPTGTPIAAPAAGTIVQAGANGGYGNSVTVALGNGLTVLLGHLSSIAVKVGQAVTGGQQLGLSGSTGASSGPHLHFEVRQNGTPIDPTSVSDTGTGATGGVIGGVNGGGIVQGIVDTVQPYAAALSGIGNFLNTLSQPDTWMRVALVAGGVGLAVFGLWYIASEPGNGE